MSPEPLVRVYGPARLRGSQAMVCLGVREGLETLGLLAGFVPTDTDYNDDEQTDGACSAPGAEAPVAVYCGPLPGCAVVRRGWHERRYAIVAPNSTWMPKKMVDDALEHVDLVAPSSWAVSVLRRYVPAERVTFWAHGVLRAMAPRRVQTFCPLGPSPLLHVTSSIFERKGTAALLDAWDSLVAEWPCSGIAPELRIGSPSRLPLLRFARSGVVLVGGMGGLVEPTELCERYLRMAAVVQPSRAEGFGLVPLEALACGIPVVATCCTGHAEYLASMGVDEGVAVVRHGEDADIDDGPGALAPAVAAEAILEALRCLVAGYPDYSYAAMTNARSVREQWAWEATTAGWARQVGLL